MAKERTVGGGGPARAIGGAIGAGGVRSGRRVRQGLCRAVPLTALAAGAVWLPAAASSASSGSSGFAPATVCEDAGPSGDSGPSGGSGGHAEGGGDGGRGRGGDCGRDGGKDDDVTPAPSLTRPGSAAGPRRRTNVPRTRTGRTDAPPTRTASPAARASGSALPAANEANGRSGGPSSGSSARSTDAGSQGTGLVALSVTSAGGLGALIAAGFGARNRLRRLR